MKALAVIGHFDPPKKSNYAAQLAAHISTHFEHFNIYNGGTWEDLLYIITQVGDYDVLFWFADLPNDRPKMVEGIKEVVPKCILVSSKSNVEGKYMPLDLIARALKSKSNLLVEFTSQENRYLGTIYDPLGNVFVLKEENIQNLAEVLAKRALQLTQFTRVQSIEIDQNGFTLPPRIRTPQQNQIEVEVPNDIQFFEIISKYAEKFHELIHGVHQDRLLGNASFRCTYGMPAFRKDKFVFVSRRNIDKRGINRNNFVPVNLHAQGFRLYDPIYYCGKYKPSVDAPIQLILFSKYPTLNYILHSHTYIQGASFTNSVIPCGAVEEVEEVEQVMTTMSSSPYFINLRGHGSLALVEKVADLENIPYVARSIPELV